MLDARLLVPVAALGLLTSSPAAADDPAVVAAAIRVCQQAAGQKEEPGPMLEGPALVVEASEKLQSWRFQAMLQGPPSAQPKTVFCALSRFEKAGTYTDGSEALGVAWNVTALSWPDGKVRRRGSVYAAPPMSKSKSYTPETQFGSVSASTLESWLKGATSEVLLASFTGSAFLSPDRRTLAVAVGSGDDRSAQLHDWPSQAMRQRIGKSWPDGFLPDGRLMIRQKKGVELWDTAAGRQVGTIPVTGFPIAFSRDGTRAIATKDRTDTFWDLKSGRALGKTGSDLVVWTETTAMSNDGQYVCANLGDKFALWDTTAGRAVATFDLKDVPPVNLDPNNARCALSGDGKVAALDARQGLYKLSADGTAQRLGDSLGSGICLGLSNTGQWLAVGGGRELIVWDFTQGKEALRSKSQGTFPCSVTFSTDDSLLWQSGRYALPDSRTEVWDARRLFEQAAAGRR